MSGTAYNPSQAQDVVAIFDSNFNQLFADARPLKASVKQPIKLMRHPVESGATIIDFKIVEPVKISLPIVVLASDYVNVFSQIVQVASSAQVVSVQTNVGLYTNMLIADYPHEEDPAHFDTIKMTLSLEEVQFATNSVSALPPSMTTANGGNKSGKAATATQEGEATKKTQGSSAAYSFLYGH